MFLVVVVCERRIQCISLNIFGSIRIQHILILQSNFFDVQNINCRIFRDKNDLFRDNFVCYTGMILVVEQIHPICRLVLFNGLNCDRIHIHCQTGCVRTIDRERCNRFTRPGLCRLVIHGYHFSVRAERIFTRTFHFVEDICDCNGMTFAIADNTKYLVRQC